MNKSYYNTANSSLWLFTLAVFCALILPRLVQDGMFLDGIFYAAISRNLAHHLGTFWNPHYSNTFYPSLHEQPPLMFWLQAQFFRLLGDSMYVERIYSLLTAIITALGINLIWKELSYHKPEIKQYGWLPVLFWIIVPICFWSYVNNLEECTMSLFDVFAVYFIIKSLNQTNKIPLLLISGGFILLASLTKGPQGLFPLCIIIVRYFTHKDISFKRTLIYSVVLVLLPAIIYTYFYTNPIIRESYHQYFLRRFVLTFNNNNQTTNFRLYLLFRLIGELTPALLLTGISMIFARKKIIVKEFFHDHKRDFYFFLFIGLSASLPLMITLEQRGFYLTTSFPYFAIAFALIVVPFIYYQINLLTNKFIKGFKVLSLVMLIVVILTTFSAIGKTKRDEDMLHDIYLMGKEIPPRTVISVDRDLFYNWSLHAYLQRYFHISLDEDTLRNYHLIEKINLNPKSIPNNYSKINLPTTKYDLYHRK